MNLLDIPKKSRWEAIKYITEFCKTQKISGFGGECAEMAVAMNEILFNNQGTLTAGLNVVFEQKNIIIGHFCLLIPDEEWKNVYVDFDGYPKDQDQILSWGMLDHTDPDYIEIAKKNKINFNEDTAYEAALFEMDIDEALSVMPGSSLNIKKEFLLLGIKKYFANYSIPKKKTPTM